MNEKNNPFKVPDPEQARKAREYTALFRLTERHATGAARTLWEQRRLPMEPFDAVRRIADLAAGAAQLEPEEPPLDADDISAALTLTPRAKAEFEGLEAGLLQMARGRGMTWQEIAFGLGLGTAQAARQRHERLSGRTDPDQ